MLLTTVLTVMTMAPFLACDMEPSNVPLVLDVWPGTTPHDSGIGEYGPISPERVRDPSDAPTKTATWITGVTHPTITVYRPSNGKNTSAAFIVCPGGGYWNLAWDLEGTEVAEWLRSKGITGIVLKYRVPRRAGEPESLPAPGPLLDAQRAVSLVRSKAKEWDIDPNHIGIGGFSAGGHLALATATHFDQRMYAPLDEIDKVSCRPDFAVAAYPGYLVDIKTWELRPSIRIPAGTPPVFLVHAFGDTEPGASSAHSAVMFLALKKAGVPTELHIYAEGDHGFGVRNTSLPVSTWGDRCLDWLRNLSMLTRKFTQRNTRPFPGRASSQPLHQKHEEQKAMGASIRSYRTHFRRSEDPISEKGKWITGAKTGIDWYDVLTRNGLAFGAVSRGAYTDPTALLTGEWGKNQTVKAKVSSRNQTEKYFQEVEIRLRSTLKPHLCTGYEVFFRCLKTPNAYAEIVRWNGKVGDWISLQKHMGAQYGVKDGDLVEATIVGNVIKGYINGVEVISAVDDTYTEGSPGMGFNYGVEESNGDFGFTYYEVDTYNN